MNNDWNYLESCYQYVNLIRDGFMTLDDLVDADWYTCNQILIEERFHQEQKQAHAEKVAEIFGSPNNRQR